MHSLLTAAIFGGIVLLVWKIAKSYLDMLNSGLPGPKPLPIVGNAHMFKTNGYEFNAQLLGFAEEYKKHGLLRAWIGTHLVVMVTRADTAETILSSTSQITKSYLYGFLHQWLATGLLTSTGEKWQKRRKMLTPSFHFRILQDFVRVFNEQASVFAHQLRKHSGGPEFDVSQYVTRCTLDIICETAMGKQLNSQTDRNSDYVVAVYRMCEIVMLRMKYPWYWPEMFFSLSPIGREHAILLKTLHDFTNNVISERRAEFKIRKSAKNESDSAAAAAKDDIAFMAKKKVAFLDMLLEAEGADQLSNEDLREEVDTFMFEGHDTTASGLKWAIYLIGKHKDVQQKLHGELNAIFGDSDRGVTMEDLSAMKYLEAVVKETLRLYPPVPIYARKLTEDCIFNDFKVPKDSTIMVMVQAIQRNAESFSEPMLFKPERWMTNDEARNPFAYIPFSAGMRNCIGQKFAMMEEKVILSTLLRHYSLDSTMKEEDLRPAGEIVLRPEAGVHIRLHPITSHEL